MNNKIIKITFIGWVLTLCLCNNAIATIEEEVTMEKKILPISIQQQEEFLLDKATMLFHKGQTSKAKDILVDITKKNTNQIQATCILADIYITQNKFSLALNLLEKTLQKNNNHPSLLLLIAKIYARQQQLEKCTTFLAKIPTHAHNQEYLALHASINYQLKKYEAARNSYLKLLKNDDAYGPWWLGLAITDETIGNNNLAVKSYTKAKLLGGLSETTEQYIDNKLAKLTKE